VVDTDRLLESIESQDVVPGETPPAA
jgi:hypothetical protein